MILRRALQACLASGLLLIFSGMLVQGAQAEALAPWWGVTTGTRPSNLPAEGHGEVYVTAQNLGDTAADGESVPVRLTDVLPAGLTFIGYKAVAGQDPVDNNRGPVTCTHISHEVVCKWSSASLPPFEQIEVEIQVGVASAASSGEVNRATVSGGGAVSEVEASHAITLGDVSKFGFEEFKMVPEDVGGTLDTRAGSHPFQLTSVVTFNSQTPDSQGRPRTAALPKDVIAELPPGLVGNPTPFAKCTDAQFGKGFTAEGGSIVNECPPQSAIGVATATIMEPKALGFLTVTTPIFNMTPRNGEPARFGFKAAGIFPVYLDTAVRTGKDYGVTVTSSSITQIAWSLSAKLTIWGVPGDSRHDKQRGWECLKGFGFCPTSTSSEPPPFLAMPTSCESPFQASIRGSSWGSSEHPAETAMPLEYRLPEGLDGCNQLPFEPSIHVSPDSTAASSPAGLNVDVHVPQATLSNPNDLAPSAVKQIRVSLPEGMVVNPAGAGGLEACTEGQVGYLPGEDDGETLAFTPEAEGLLCPDAAKVGTVDISSPLLPPGQHVTGGVYLATQNANPFGSLIAMYIVATDPISGTVVKQAGEVHLTEAGQLVTTLKGIPQLPFEDAELHFFGGARAALVTPKRCGEYTTSASLSPWSGNPPASVVSTFDITTGPAGTPCPGAHLPFAPALTAGSASNRAGGFTAFTTTISRGDGSDELSSVSVHTPPGLSGVLTGIPLCGEAQASTGTCGPESLIGESTVSAGAGPEPITIGGGKVYLTGPYHGAPFGLSIASPAKAGPFDLENTPVSHPACDCVVVRARIEVDPHTAELTVTTDPAGPYAIPQMIEGVPVQLRRVNVTISRPGFMFNPTSCAPLTVTGAATGSEGSTQALSSPFQVNGCASLKFAPVFRVFTSAKTSRLNGASLKVKLSYPKAAFGSQTNIHSVKVELPRQLPSRLTTLQKACLASVFEANPAGCPSTAIVGHAKVITPVLPVPLEGPAYFVSHGNEAFPSLTLVLQGYGVTVELVGSTLIRNGITSSTFKTTPDVPFSTFELNLPEGRFSALAAVTNLCKTKLAMPTYFVAQNGAEKRQSTKISVTGCAKKKRNPAHRKAKRHKKH